ncbi:MAG: hypothetical protein K8J31_09550, partial [Anaerolineae bacterium]|nr:hypothetical protein [Anaerolineae bacterium]
VQRRPVVYCLESIDLPADVHVSQIGISRHASFVPDTDSSFDGIADEVRILRGPVQVIEGKSWDGQLYRPALPQRLREIETQLIPYFAWDNRGKSEMTVWIPELQSEGRIS